jgi:hypothetical protein
MSDNTPHDSAAMPPASLGSVRPEQVESRKMSPDEFAAAIDAEALTLPVLNTPPATLTDAEREAIEYAWRVMRGHSSRHSTALRGLLERTK